MARRILPFDARTLPDVAGAAWRNGLLQSLPHRLAARFYNARMNKRCRRFLLSCCCLLATHAMAQAPVREPMQYAGPEGMPERRMSPEERMQHREEARQNRENWRQMSPEERHRLRSDIRDAGRSLYPGRPRSREARR